MKKILILLTMLMLIIPMVTAPPVPAPVTGKVMIGGGAADSYTVTVDNGRTGESFTVVTDKKGYYSFDMGNEFNEGYIAKSAVYVGDEVTLTVSDVSVSFKAETFPYYPETINIDGEPTPPIEGEVDKLSSNEAKTTSTVDLLYGQEVNLVIANNKIAKLLDDDIKFNSETYDIREEVRLVGATKTSIDDVDYLLDVYLEVEELSYSYIFDDLIDLDEVDREEILEITFLGKLLKISEVASAKEITLISGTEYDLSEGDSVDVEGVVLTVKIITAESVSVSYNGQVETIDEGEVGEVGGIEIYVEDVIEDDDGPDLATIRVGVDIEEVIEDGDDYDDTEKFEWVIDMPNSIGIINQDPFNDLEDNPPVKAGEVISLPEDYLDVKLSVPSVKMYELEVRVDGNYLRVDGEFSKDTEDYNEVYLNSNGFYDEDEVFIGTSVEIGDSNIALEMGSLKIGDLLIQLDMSDILLNGVSYALKDEDFLDYLGVIFKDPEQAVEDQRNFRVDVPEERPEATIIIGEEVEADEEEEECKVTVCDETTCKDTVCSTTTCPTEKVCEVCQDCPEDDNNLVAIIIAGILGATGGAGTFFKLFNKKIFLSANTGVKTYRGRNGDLKLLHKHPGTKGYHNPETSHRAPETHPRGMVDVASGYQKNPKGEWEYVG